MTPEQCARFILSDCQDPELKELARREMEADHAEAMKDPAYKAKWDANIKAFADEIDRRAMEAVKDLFAHGIIGSQIPPLGCRILEP